MDRLPLIVSERFRWHEKTNEFEDTVSGARHPDSSYDVIVSVYEDRVSGWFLHVASDLVAKGQAPADYAALSIALAYIEGVEQYRQGAETPPNQAGKWFCRSAERIFTDAPKRAFPRLWREARCGLFHSGFTIGRTYLAHAYPKALLIEEDRLIINPKRFVEAVIADFGSFVAELRRVPTGRLATRFQRLWSAHWERS